MQTSPVVDHGHPALLEVWINKADQKKNIDLCDEEFTSPPFPQNTSPFSTPLVQRLGLRLTNVHVLYRFSNRQFPL